METVVSGIRPTGNLHLGNYFGAVKGFLQMQNEYNCFFFIADWHSLTTHPHPDNIRNSVKTILAEYLACGIDPEKATIYLQSDVREIPELYLYLNMNAGIGELMRTTSFKDKARQQLHIDRVNTTEGDVEKEIFNGTVDYDHLDTMWNDKYEAYLGIRPEHDKEGILQDMHWGGALLGYFPTYAL